MKVTDLAISDSGFVFNPTTGESFTANATGLFILNSLKQGKQEDEIIDMMLEEFDSERSNCEKDYFEFLNMLTHYKLIQTK